MLKMFQCNFYSVMMRLTILVVISILLSLCYCEPIKRLENVSKFNSTFSQVNNVTTKKLPWDELVEASFSHRLSASTVPRYLKLNDLLQASNFNDTSNPKFDQCTNDVHHMLSEALNQSSHWATSSFNSWAASLPPVGFLSEGTLSDLGDFDQCLRSTSNGAPLNPMMQYCVLQLALPLPRPRPSGSSHNLFHRLKLMTNGNDSILNGLSSHASLLYYAQPQIGICLPATCEDVGSFTRNYIDTLGLSLESFHCQKRLENDGIFSHLNLVQISAILLIALMCVLMAIAAIFKYFQSSNKSKNTKQNNGILAWFDPISNLASLLSTTNQNDTNSNANQNQEDSSSNREVACVHGIRVITIIWVIVVHTLDWNDFAMFRSAFQLRVQMSHWLLQPLYKGHYAVDTFFYLSGFLLAYVAVKMTGNSSNQMSATKVTVTALTLRYIRLTPQLGLFLWLTPLLAVFFSGPVWPQYIGKVYTDKCYPYWWRNLLYVQNLFDVGQLCAIHTWFLAADMQLHVASMLPIVLLLVHRSVKASALSAVVLIVLSTIISMVTIVSNDFPSDFVVTSRGSFLEENGTLSQFNAFMFKPWAHSIVFFGGFLFGLFVGREQMMKGKSFSSSICYSRRTKALAWTGLTLCHLAVMYSSSSYLDGSVKPPPLLSALQFVLTRTLWTIVLSGLLWLCVTGNGGVIGRVLAWPAFRPLSRLTYATYLCHAWVVWVSVGTLRQPIPLENMANMVVHCIGVCTVAVAVAMVFSVVVESPLIHLVRCFRMGSRRSKSKSFDLKSVKINNTEDEEDPNDNNINGIEENAKLSSNGFNGKMISTCEMVLLKDRDNNTLVER